MLAILLLLPATAEARLKQLTVKTDSLKAGALCGHRFDEKVPAPAVKDGEVGLDHKPYHFVLESDVVPSLPDIGVGIVVRLHDFRRGEQLTLQAGKVQVGVTPDTWQIVLNDDGSFWVATTPDPGTRLDAGVYRFTALRGGKAFLIYEFDVRPATKADIDLHLCGPAVS